MKSPCTNKCKLDYVTQKCIGCNRTLDEIINYGKDNKNLKERIKNIERVVRKIRKMMDRLLEQIEGFDPS